MGYEMRMMVLNKRDLHERQKNNSDYTFKDLYIDVLKLERNPYDNEDIKYRDIFESSRDIFCDFFSPKILPYETVLIDKNTYFKMIFWMEEILKSKTLYQFTCEENNDLYKMQEMINIYKKMKKEIVDFENEFVIFTHDW